MDFPAQNPAPIRLIGPTGLVLQRQRFSRFSNQSPSSEQLGANRGIVLLTNHASRTLKISQTIGWHRPHDHTPRPILSIHILIASYRHQNTPPRITSHPSHSFRNGLPDMSFTSISYASILHLKSFVHLFPRKETRCGTGTPRAFHCLSRHWCRFPDR